MSDKLKLKNELLKSKMLKAMPELKTNNKSKIGINGTACPKLKYSSARYFATKSIAIKKNITK